MFIKKPLKDSMFIYWMVVMVAFVVSSGTVKAIDYEPQPDKAMVMILCAHPDDEGIFYGAVMAYYTKVLKVPTVLICTTLGEYAYDYSGVLNPGQEVKPLEFPICVQRYGFPNEAILPLFQQTRYDHTVARSWQDWSNGPRNQVANNDVALGKQTMSRYLAEQIRRYQPEVVVTLDFDGEYGHPNHKCMAKGAEAAWDLANGTDTSITDSSGTHTVSAAGIPGTPWQVKKLYSHRYGSHQLFHDFGEELSIDTNGDGIMDQTPRDAVEYGLSALSYTGDADVATVFETDDRYDAYHSEWYGLVRTTVGYDTVLPAFSVPGDTTGTTYTGWARGDFLEHITYSYDEAESPMPRDYQSGLYLNPLLEWTAGPGAVRHDVYFGTDHSAVANATTASATYQGQQSGTAFDPGFLAKDETYYWRIDEVQADGADGADGAVVRGWVWEFSTVNTSSPNNPGPIEFVNGDLETGDLTGWGTLSWGNAADMTIDSSSPLAGNHSLTTGSDSTVRGNYQDTGTLTDFTYSMLFRIESLGTGGTARAMDWNLSSTPGGSSGGDLRFIVDGGGIFGNNINGGSGWTALTGGAFNPSVGVTYRWKISASGFDGVGGRTARFDVEIFNGATLVYTSVNNVFTSAGADKLPVESLNFIRGGNWGGGGYTIDDVFTPEVPEIPPFADADADGLDDLWEEHFFGDRDGVVTFEELAVTHGGGDTDGDGVDDLTEFTNHTDPNSTDSDSDGLSDAVENNMGTWVSVDATGTNPLNPDTDGDGLLDGAENPDLSVGNPPTQYQTNPNLDDSDLDLWSDGAEVAAGTAPANASSTPEGSAPTSPITGLKVAGSGFNTSDVFRITFVNLNPSKSYVLKRSDDLQIFTHQVGSPVTGKSQITITDLISTVNQRYFYRLEEME